MGCGRVRAGIADGGREVREPAVALALGEGQDWEIEPEVSVKGL